MIFLLTAAAIALSGEAASVRVPLSDIPAAAPRAALSAAAEKACRAIGESGPWAGDCVEDATDRAVRDYRSQLRAQRKVALVSRR